MRSMRGKVASIVVFMVLLIVPSIGLAHPDKYKGLNKERKIMERIQTLRMWKLTKALDLDQETAAELFPILNKYDKKRARIEREIREDIKELRKALKEDDTGRIIRLTDEIQDKRNKLCKINRDEMKEVGRVLDLKQQARYILFQQEFRRHIRDIVYEARKGYYRKHEEDHE